MYQYCLDNKKQGEYLTKLKQYQTPKENYEVVLDVDYQKKYENFIKNTFNFKLKIIKNLVDIDDIYKKNKQKINTEYYLEDKIESLLYFKDTEKVIKNWIENSQEEQQKVEQQKQSLQQEKNILETEYVKFKPSQTKNRNNHQLSGRHNNNQERQQKEAGDKAEQKVYDTLVKEHKKNDVHWVSKTDDYAGYDIRYKDENNKWWYVEVKTQSNNCFYMSKNEKQFADKHSEEWQLFLVGGDTIKIVSYKNFYELIPEVDKYKYLYLTKP